VVLSQSKINNIYCISDLLLLPSKGYHLYLSCRSDIRVSRDSLFGIVTRLCPRCARNRGSFTKGVKAFKPVLWFTQPRTQWVTRTVSQGVKRPECEAHLFLPRLGMSEATSPITICLHALHSDIFTVTFTFTTLLANDNPWHRAVPSLLT
jgi:hypothetical protein